MNDKNKSLYGLKKQTESVVLPQKIRTWTQKQSICPKCGETLVNGCTFIPGAERYKVSGKRCFSCGSIYVERSQKEEIISHLAGNYEAWMFSLDGIFYGRYVEAKDKTGSSERLKKPALKDNPNIKHLCPIPEKIHICPFCHAELRDDYAIRYHGVSSGQKGSVCYSCKTLFARDYSLLRKMAKTDQEYNLLNCYKPPEGKKYSPPQKEVWCKVLLHNKKSIRRIMIVMSKQDRKIEQDIYHYTDGLALTVLTALLLEKKYIEISQESFLIDHINYGPGANRHLLSFKTGITVLEKNNGGYFDTDDSVKIVDGLVFAEKTRRLEILKVSYSPKQDEYYVDYFGYKNFCDRFGLPYVRYIPNKREHRKTASYDWDLNPESILHQLGYNVGMKDELTDGERQSILAQCVSMGYMTVHGVISLLRSLIRRNGGRSYQSVLKWEKDIEFISNYKVDADQMAFVSKIMRIR